MNYGTPPQPPQQQPAPPINVPNGWDAVWDSASQRYYFVELATGRSQWEMPIMPSNGAAPVGEASSYSGGGGSQHPGDNMPVNPPHSYSDHSPQPQQGGGDDRGLGSMLSGLAGQSHYGSSSGYHQGSGGFGGSTGNALVGGLLGYAAGKIFNNKQQQHHYPGGQYPPPPAHSSGGFGALSGLLGGNHHGGGHGYNQHGGQYPPPPPPPSGGFGALSGLLGGNHPGGGHGHNQHGGGGFFGPPSGGHHGW